MLAAKASLRRLRAPAVAMVLLWIGSLSAAPCAPHVTIDVCDLATGSLQSVSYGTAPSAQPVPTAPWLLNDPKVLKQIREHRLPPNVDNPALSPVHRKRAAEGFSKPVSGTWQALLILVDFPGTVSTKYAGVNGRRHFNELLFSKNVYPTGSMRDWYLEASYNTFEVTGLVAGGPEGWLRAPQTLAYYAAGAAGFGSYPNNSFRFGEDALALADPYVNYSRYDNDKDGIVDALFIVHAGSGSETTGSPNDLHSCLWSGMSIQRDAVRITSFSLEPEDGEIGVFAHEFGHALGLPDLYDYGYDSWGIGMYSMMAFGTWGGGGSRPVGFDAYCKELLGWNKPAVITSTKMAAPLPAAETSPVAYKLWTAGAVGNEYFLVENRQRLGFDAALPAEGVMIWHIDRLGSNDDQWHPPMAPQKHYMVALEQADGLWSLEKAANMGEASDSFPGALGRTYFNAAGLLNTRAYLTGPTHVTVSNISRSGANMTANLSAVNRAPLPPAAVNIKPKKALVTSTLKATTTGSIDPDGDMRRYYYSWSKWDGTKWGAWSHYTTTGVLFAKLRVGEKWRARGRVGDGSLYSGWRTSAPVTIVRSPAAVALTVGAAAAPTRTEGAAITVNLSAAAAVEIQICNLAGRIVGQLPRQHLEAGARHLLWNGSSVNGTSVPSGMYVVKVTARGDDGTQAQALSSLAVRR
ncbi:MAG: M6 family metalloprotease domain-containing protein [Armatimonadota bacterium]